MRFLGLAFVLIGTCGIYLTYRLAGPGGLIAGPVAPLMVLVCLVIIGFGPVLWHLDLFREKLEALERRENNHPKETR